MGILVQKFGGSSVADVDKIRHVAGIVAASHASGNQTVVVVSAMGKTTDSLVNLATQLNKAPQGREYDMLLATGEMVSASLLALCLQELGLKAVALNGGQAGVQTEDLFNRARITNVDTQAVLQYLNAGYIVVVTGFQGVNSEHEITTLGRGGSDTSAVAIAGALKADCCDIYTDVTGVYSTDPRVVSDAVKLDEIAYIEMMELARLGSKVLHPRSVEAARRWGIKVRVRSTFKLEDNGTIVLDEQDMTAMDERVIAGVTCDKNQALVAVLGMPDEPGSAAKVFTRLSNEGISVDMIIQSTGKAINTNDIAFTVNTWDLQNAQGLMDKLLGDLGAKSVKIDDQIAKISIVGVGMIDRPGIASGMFEALAEAGVNIKMISTSEIKISVLVDKVNADKAVQAIHAKFFVNEVSLVESKSGY
jgi:aspartate kinase